MTCANPACRVQTRYLRRGAIFEVDFPGGSVDAGECQIIQRRVIWLCDACVPRFAVETWRPPGEQVRPSRRILKASGCDPQGASPEAWN